MTDKASRLRVADAKSHMVVCIGEAVRYLYKDATGWYVLGYPERADERYYLQTDGEYFKDVTT